MRKSGFATIHALAVSTGAAALLAGFGFTFMSEPVDLKDLPDPVRRTIRQHLDGAKLVEVELETTEGRKIYEVEAEREGKSFEFAVTSSGRYITTWDDNEDRGDDQDRNRMDNDDEEGHEHGRMQDDDDDENSDAQGHMNRRDDDDEEDSMRIDRIGLDQLPGVVRDRLADITNLDSVLVVERHREVEEDDGRGDTAERDLEDVDETIYEVEFKGVHGKSTVVLTAQGSIVEVEHPIEVDKLPEAVLRELREEFPDAKIGESNAVQRFYYEIEVTIDGRTVELLVDPSGDVVGHERGRMSREEEGDDDDSSVGKGRDRDDDDGHGDDEEDDDHDDDGG